MPNVIASVVVCTRGRPAETLRSCLSALCRQELDDAIEIVIVDGNSDNRAEAALPDPIRRRTIMATHLQVGGRQSMISARHVGVQAASGEYVAFIDDDCIASKSWLRSMLSCARKDRLDGLQGRTLGWRHESFMEKFARFDESQMMPSRLASGEIFNISTVNALYRRQLLGRMNFHLDRTNWLEARGIFVGFEDYLITQEALRLEARLGYCDEAVVEHMHPRTLKSKMRQFRQYGWNAFGYCWITRTDPTDVPGYNIPSSPTIPTCVRSWVANSPRLVAKYRAAAGGNSSVLEKLAFPLVCSILEFSYLLGARACARAIREVSGVA